MRWLKKILGGEPDLPAPDERTVEELRADPNMIAIFDEYGREMFVDRDTWRTDILPGSIEQAWANPDELYTIVVQALSDGFDGDVLSAAKRLAEIDSDAERGACILGITLMRTGKLDEAEDVLESYLRKRGQSGVVLTNLAKVHSERGNDEASLETLLKALEVDPNQDNAVEWWFALHHDRDGEAGGVAALKRIADIEGSWRPQIWLARVALEGGNKAQAIAYYRQILSRVSPLPSDIMGQMSGDLGNAGLLQDMVDLLGSHFDAKLHGPMGGNNLIKAYLDLGDALRARAILDQLEALGRPDWREHLAFWEAEIDKQSGRYGPADAPARITSLAMSKPVWVHKLEGGDSLLPPKEDRAARFVLWPASVEQDGTDGQFEIQRTDREGTLSRCVPLLLAEQIQMRTTSSATMLIPIVEDEGSFVLIGARSDNESIAKLAGNVDADYAFNMHLDVRSSPWVLHVSLFSCAAPTESQDFTYTIEPDSPGRGITECVEQGIQHISSKVTGTPPPTRYKLPTGNAFNEYIGCLSQSLAQSVATMTRSDESLYGERDILDRALNLALDNPESDVARLLFLSALAKARAYDSKLVDGYRDKAQKLIAEMPLDGIAAEVSQRTLAALW